MRTKKKLLSLFLALAMVLTCVSSVVFADNTGVSVAKFKVFKSTTLDGIDEANAVFDYNDVGSHTMIQSPASENADDYALCLSDDLRGKLATATVKQWPTGNKPITAAFDMTGGALAGYNFGYFFLKDKNGNAIGTQMNYQDGALLVKKISLVNGTVGNTNEKYCGFGYLNSTDSNYAEIDPSKNVHYDFNFKYTDTAVTITVTTKGTALYTAGTEVSVGGSTYTATGDAEANATISYKLSDYNLDVETLTPMFATAGNSGVAVTGKIYVDNFNVTSYADEALEYLDSNELFTKNSEDVTADDTDNSVAAREAYATLSNDVKAVLNADNGADVLAFLNAVDAKIESLSVPEKVAAYKNAYAAVLNKSVDSMTEDDLITFAKAVDAYNAFTPLVQSDSEITALKALIDAKSADVLANIKTSRSVDFSQSKWIRDNYFASTAATVTDADTFVTYTGDAEFASTDGTPITHSEVTWQYPAGATTVKFYPVSGNSTCLTAKGDTGAYESGYLCWVAEYEGNAKTFACEYGNNLKGRGADNRMGLWNISATKTPQNGWVKFEFDYDWSQYSASKKLTVKTTATFSGKNVLYSAGVVEGSVYDKTDDTYKSTVYKTYKLTDDEPANVAFKLSSNSTINIKAMGVQTAQAAADEFNLKYSAITADSADFVTAKAELEKLDTKAAERVSAEIKNVLSAEKSATFVSDDFSDASKSEKNWIGGVVTQSFDKNLTSLSKKNTLLLNSGDEATLTEAVWPKGTKPAYMSVTYSGIGTNQYIMFAGDKTVAEKGGFGLFLEGVAHKTATLNNGAFAVQGNEFFIGSGQAYNENGTMNKALKSNAYNNTYWTTLDMKFDYSVAGKVAVTMDIYIYSNDNSDRVVFSSVKRTYSVGDMSDFRPYFYANNGTLKIADFKYYTEEQLAKNTVFADEGANIYLGDTAKGALSFSGSVAVKDSIAYKAITTENYAANLGKSVLINNEDINIAANKIDALLPIIEIGAQVWAKKVPTAADIKTVNAAENASTFGVVISGTNVDPTLDASRISVHTKLYVKLGGYTVESNEITMSRNKALRKTAAYYVTQGQITAYTAENALDSTKTDITTIKNDVYTCLGITE